MLRRLGRLVAVIVFYLVVKWLCSLAFQGVSWAADDTIAYWANTVLARRFDIPASTATTIFRFLIEWGPLALFLAIESFVIHKLDSRSANNPTSQHTDR